MPAKEIFFTFDTKVKINKKTVLQFVQEFENEIRLNFSEIKLHFGVSEINEEFLKKFISELKNFDCVSIEDRDVHGIQRIIKNFVYTDISNEFKEPISLLGLRYLYDKWEYEGCGSEDHYYLTFTDDVKLIKKTIKETEKLVKLLVALGVDANLTIKHKISI